MDGSRVGTHTVWRTMGWSAARRTRTQPRLRPWSIRAVMLNNVTACEKWNGDFRRGQVRLRAKMTAPGTSSSGLMTSSPSMVNPAS